MITHRSVRFALCAFFLVAPLATLAAQDGGLFYLSAAYSAAFPGDLKIGDDTVSTELGFLGGRVSVGYSIFGFRPELSASYRMATIKDSDGTDSVTTMDVIPSVYFDVGTGSPATLYIGIGGGISQVTVVKQPDSKSVLALSVQGAVGIGYEVMEDLALTLGYRLTGTASIAAAIAAAMDAIAADFPVDTGGDMLEIAFLSHNVEIGIRYSF